MRRLILVTALFLPLLALGDVVVYIPDNTTVFCNPERGFYHHTEQIVTSKGETKLSASHFTAARKEGHTLLLRLYYFHNFRTKDLPEAVLTQVNSDFDLFRKNGCKAVLRFAYDNDNDDGYQDATPAMWKRHLEQLKPILQANADVIAVVQAGFMGAWGEWYFSSQGEGSEIPQKVKNDLIDQLLDAVPASRSVQLRTPDYKRDYFTYKQQSTDALTSAEAYTGSARARLGHHNDAFLYQSDNMGTYSNREVDMNYLDQECLYVPNGGETDVYKESVYKDWATGAKAKAEMAQLHYSYLNEGYAALTLDHWRDDGTFKELDRKMGYRLQLVESSIPSSAAIGGRMPVRFSIRNVGYATMYNERKAYLVLTNTNKTYTFELQTDPRRWLPNGAVTEVEDSIALPAQMAAGVYNACLWLPDMASTIQKDARFAVRLANQDVWDDNTGYNSLLTTVTVSGQGGPDDPDPTPSADVDPITGFRAEAGANSATLRWTNPGTAAQTELDLTTGVSVASSSASAQHTCSNGVSTVTYSSADTWQWAGVEIPVNNVEHISSICFDYQGDGSTCAFYPYAWDNDYRWRSEDYIDLSSTEWQSVSFTPSITLWADNPSHEFGDRPITQIGFIVNPGPVGSGSFKIRNVRIQFEQDPASDFAGVRIIRKAGSAPSSYSDGTAVYYGKDSFCVDQGLSAGVTYYYAAYAFNTSGEIAYPDTCSITIGSADLPAAVRKETRVDKFMHNGRLYIRCKDKLYNALGQPVR